MFGGTAAELNSRSFTAIGRYSISDQFSVHAGVRYQTLDGEVTLAGNAFGPLGVAGSLNGYNVEMSNGKQRTARQNNALHIWLGMVAKGLNDQGRDMRKTLKPDIEIPWTKYTAKDHLWRPVQIAVCGQESTVDAEKIDYVKVFEVLNRHFGEKFQLHIPWPVKNES
jgi:hypothetical protein